MHYLCIRDTTIPAEHYFRRTGIRVLPYILGRVYTLRDVSEHRGYTYFHFEEVRQPLSRKGRELGIGHKNFRLLPRLTPEHFQEHHNATA